MMGGESENERNNGGQISVPPGFRFHPTDEELLHYYLRKKVSSEPIDLDVIREVDLNKLEPWDLKEKCRIGSGDESEWYLFSHKDKKYPTGSRTNRATRAGFWKATGRDKAIHHHHQQQLINMKNNNNGRHGIFHNNSNMNPKRIGMRKTLVFYTGRAPHGQKTDWIMHEYRLLLHNNHHHSPHFNAPLPEVQEDGWVVCRVFKKKSQTRGLEGVQPEDEEDEEGGDDMNGRMESVSVGPKQSATRGGGVSVLQLQRQQQQLELEMEGAAPHDYYFLNAHSCNNNNNITCTAAGNSSMFNHGRDQDHSSSFISYNNMHLPQLLTFPRDLATSLLSSDQTAVPSAPTPALLAPHEKLLGSSSYHHQHPHDHHQHNNLNPTAANWSFLDKLLGSTSSYNHEQQSQDGLVLAAEEHYSTTTHPQITKFNQLLQLHPSPSPSPAAISSLSSHHHPPTSTTSSVPLHDHSSLLFSSFHYLNSS